MRAVHDALNDPQLAYGVFRLAQQQNQQIRRVIWLPIRFDSQPVSPANPRLVLGSSGPTYRRAYGQESWHVEAHITGKTFEDAESLRERILAAVRSVFGTGSSADGGLWVNQSEGEAQAMYGDAQKVIQRFVWTINVLAPDEPATTIVAVEGPEIPGPEVTAEPAFPDPSVEPPVAPGDEHVVPVDGIEGPTIPD